MTTEITNKSIIAKLVPIYQQVEELTLEAKEILAEAKEADLDSALLAKVAKAIASSKLADLEDKTQGLLDFIEEVK